MENTNTKGAHGKMKAERCALLLRVGLAGFFWSQTWETFTLAKVWRVIKKQHRSLIHYHYTTFNEFWITTEERKSLASSHHTSYEENYCGGRSQTIIRLAINQREENAWERFTFHSAISWAARTVGVWRLKWQEHCKHLNGQGMEALLRKTLDSYFSRLVTRGQCLLHLASFLAKELSLSSPDRHCVEAAPGCNLYLTHFKGWD